MSKEFDEKQMRCLRALLDTIIPADDYPGAWEAGVGDYILRQLGGDLARMADRYREFLRWLDAEANAQHNDNFCELSLDARGDMLRAVESGDSGFADFFAQVVEHCGEGYYSDPGNGGNRDGIAWQMVGFEVRG